MQFNPKNAPATVALCAVLLGGCASMTGHELPAVVNTKVHRGGEALDFGPESKFLVSGGWDGDIAVLDLRSGEPIRHWQAHDGAINGLRFTQDRIVSGGKDGNVIVWSMSGQRLHQVYAASPVIGLSVGERRVVSGHADGSVRTWHLPYLQPDDEFPVHEGWVYALASSRTGHFASGAADERVILWNEDGTRRVLPAAPTYTNSLTFSPDGRYLFGGGKTNLHRWDLRDGSLTVMPTKHWGTISAVQFLPHENVLATISRIHDSSVYFIDPANGKTLRKFTRQPLCGGDLRVSPDGRFMASTGDDGAVRIWDLANTN